MSNFEDNQALSMEYITTASALGLEYNQTEKPMVAAENGTSSLAGFTRELILGANMYGLPVIILLGVLGNTVSFIVFVASQLRHQSSSVYLAFLNFADCLFLLCLMVTQLGWYHVFLMRKDGICQIVVYFSYVSGFLSVWTVVSFTVERFIVVYFPLMRLVFCTKGRATMVVLALLATSLVLYNFALWTHKVQKYPWGDHYECQFLEQFTVIIQVLSIGDTILTMVLPSLIIIVFNILSAVGVWRFLRQERSQGGNVREEAIPMTEVTLTTEYDTTNHDNKYLNRSTNQLGTSGSRKGSATASITDFQLAIKRRSSTPSLPYVLRRHSSRPQSGVQLKTTRTLITISSLFVLLNLPSHAFRVWVMVHPPEGQASETVHLWQLVCQFLYYLNFSCNLFMYCACSKMFRKELKALVTLGGRKIHRAVTEWCQRIWPSRCTRR